MSKTTFTRIVNKHDLEANWVKAVNFTPLSGELIIYDVEVDTNGNTLELPSGRTVPYTFQRLKIGDGVSNVNNLPFAMSWSALGSCEEEVLFVCGTAAEHIEPEPSEQLEGTGQEFYTTAPSTMSFRSTAPLDEFQEVQVNGQTVDPSNYTLEEGSTIVKLSHNYLSTLGAGKHEVAIVSDSKTVKGDFIIKAPELNEYGFYYNQPYYGECNRSEGLTHFGGTFIIMFEENGIVNLYQIDSSNAYQTTYTFTDGKIAFEFYNDQSDSSPFTGSFSADGKTLSGSVDVTPFWGSPVTFDDIVLEVRPEEAAADNLYVYYKQHTQYAEEGTWEYFPRVRTLTEYPSAMSSILDIPVTGLAYEAFMSFEKVETIALPKTLKSLGSYSIAQCAVLNNIQIPKGVTGIHYRALAYCPAMTNISYEGTVAEWEAIYKDDDWCENSPITCVQCSDGQVAI